MKEFTDEQLLWLGATQTGLFWREEGAEFRAELSKRLKSQWDELKANPKLYLPFVWSLTLKCPPLIERHEGFEWIAEEFKKALYLQLSNQEFGEIFRDSFNYAMGTGRPTGMGNDYSRTNEVLGGMNLGMIKSRSVENVADHNGMSERTIYRSVANVMAVGNWGILPEGRPVLPLDIARKLLKQGLETIDEALKAKALDDDVKKILLKKRQEIQLSLEQLKEQGEELSSMVLGPLTIDPGHKKS